MGEADELAAADHRVPNDLKGLLRGGEESMAAARQTLRFVEEQWGRSREEAHRHNSGRRLCRAVRTAQETCVSAVYPLMPSHDLADVELLAPIQQPGKIVCVGLNYRGHLAETGETVSDYPIVFLKPTTSIIGPGQPIVLPRISRQVDYEGELAVIIGRGGKYIAKQDALSHVGGYTCANDVSAHDVEFRTSQWTSGKMLDTFCPLGPALVTGDELPNPNSLQLTTSLNGKKVQDTSTADMVFSVSYLISYISSLATLEPGDVILTGTPAGIGCNKQPPVFLKAGDHVQVEIEGLGVLSNPVVAEEEA
jgi:2-keto-4-pentenoate hydratase/2-oxohepta-3-ene-1,7-dioic acid hydratase in catechol pathway